MNEFDPNIELIDRYLRGELQGSELEAFMTKLQSDDTFRAAVSEQEKVAAAIYALGRARMKQYLAEKTRHRGSFFISKKAWYFAAASVILVALATTLFLWKVSPEMQQKIPFVKTESDTATKEKLDEDKWTLQTPSEKTSKDTSANEEIIALNQEEELPPMETDDAGSASVAVEPPEPIIIASNVQAVAISLLSQTEAQKSLKTEAMEMKRPRAADADVQPTTAKPIAKAKQSGREENANVEYKQPEQTRSKKAAMRFSLTFFETPRNAPMVQVEKYNDMYFVRCYDIVYGNPLVYELQNRYFLQSGNKVYELLNLPAQNGQKSPSVAATEVKDPAILNMIGQ
jgi:hypothetical protein